MRSFLALLLLPLPAMAGGTPGDPCADLATYGDRVRAVDPLIPEAALMEMEALTVAWCADRLPLDARLGLTSAELTERVFTPVGRVVPPQPQPVGLPLPLLLLASALAGLAAMKGRRA